jgi:hypothetical protein
VAIFSCGLAGWRGQTAVLDVGTMSSSRIDADWMSLEIGKLFAARDLSALGCVSMGILGRHGVSGLV